MTRVSGHHQAQSDTPFVHYTHEGLLLSSDVQASVSPDVLSRLESIFDHFRSGDPSVRIAAVSAVDKELDAAWIQLRSLQHLRNALAPISALPPEVLSQVFHFVSLEEPPYSKLGWIRVTHVCRLWRQVALGDSSLWARITDNLRNTEWISEILARAKNAPLDIDIDLCWIKISTVLLMFSPQSPHISHTRKLHLQYSVDFDLDKFRRICSQLGRQEAPALEHFKLNGTFTFLITPLKLGGTTLFKGAPRLRTFSLFNAFIPWSLIPRGQLTQLEISLSSTDQSVSDYAHSLHCDLNQLIDLLVNCPELKILVLESCLPSQLSEFTHGQTIDLPRLSCLRLEEPSSRITNLLKMLKLSSTTALQLFFLEIFRNTLTYNDHPSLDHSLLPVVSTHFQSTTRSELKSLRVAFRRDCSYFNYLAMTASTSPLVMSRIRQSLNFEEIEVNKYGEDWDFLKLDGLLGLGNCTDLVGQVCNMLPILNLETLSIFAPDLARGDSVNSVEVLKHCTKVSAMQVIGRGASSLVRALATPSTSTHMHAPIFPKLTSLSLKELDFFEIKHSSGIPFILFDVFQEGLRQRMVAYGALKVLRIENCTIDARRVNALKKHVQTLQWDEIIILHELIKYDSDSEDSEPALWEAIPGEVIRIDSRTIRTSGQWLISTSDPL